MTKTILCQKIKNEFCEMDKNLHKFRENSNSMKKRSVALLPKILKRNQVFISNNEYVIFRNQQKVAIKSLNACSSKMK